MTSKKTIYKKIDNLRDKKKEIEYQNHYGFIGEKEYQKKNKYLNQEQKQLTYEIKSTPPYEKKETLQVIFLDNTKKDIDFYNNAQFEKLKYLYKPSTNFKGKQIKGLMIKED